MIGKTILKTVIATILKNIWIKLLLFGILSNIIAINCGKTMVDGNYPILYIYHNKTGESLTVSYFLEERKNTVQLSPNE